ncbi:hypothetical protein BDW62DRAFT_178690 [Aspergillus aurantiobrunneus]
MVAPLMLLICTLTAVLAQGNEYEPIFIETPSQGDSISTDDFVVAWYLYDAYYDDDLTIGLYSSNFQYWDQIVFSTTVSAQDSSITLPATALPALHPDQTSILDLFIYTMDGGTREGVYASSLSLYAPDMTTPTITTTVTTTATPTNTPTPTETPDEEEEEEEEEDTTSSGLSAGAKAGIGVGVSAGVLLLAAGAFVLYRRRKSNEPPKTIREISGTGPTSAVFAPETGASGDEEKYRPVSLPLALSSVSGTVSGTGSARVSGERERERFELGG